MGSGREAVSYLTPGGRRRALPAASFESTDSEALPQPSWNRLGKSLRRFEILSQRARAAKVM